MNIALVGDFLLWCLAINYLILVLWFVVFVVARRWLYRIHNRWFRLSEERFDAVHYAGMAAYKICILLLNLAPYIALQLVGHGG